MYFTISILNPDLCPLTFSQINPQTTASDHTMSRAQLFTDEVQFHLRKITKSCFVFHHSTSDSFFLAAIEGPDSAYINGGKARLSMS